MTGRAGTMASQGSNMTVLVFMSPTRPSSDSISMSSIISSSTAISMVVHSIMPSGIMSGSTM